MFHQDNDPKKHTRMRATSWFQTKRVQAMVWPAQSPDLNLWGDIKNSVSEAKAKNSLEL